MRKLFFILLATTLLFSNTSFAGPGHSHSHGPASKEQVIEKAKKRLEILASRGTIEGSWRGKPVLAVTQKEFGKGPEWVVSFQNTQVKEKAKQTLYIFFKLDGHYLAANYTGK